MSLDKSYILNHIDKLEEDAKPLWGLMTPQHLLEHFIYVFRMAIGEVKQAIATPREKIKAFQESLHFDRRFPKFYDSPYLKKGEIEELEYETFEKAKEIFIQYFDKYEAHFLGDPKKSESHVVFGEMDKNHWDLMFKKHFDHHFRQFDLKTKVAEGYVDYYIEKGGVGVIEFFHPAHNSLPGVLLDKLVEALQVFDQHQHAKVILLKSGGNRTFCAGASFDELKRISNPEEGKRFFLGFANVLNAIRRSSKIVVGRVQGKAVGGGVGIASAVDYCFASKFASVKLSELGIGIGPFVIGPAVQRKIGLAAFSEVSLNFRKFYSPKWCQEKGLFQEVFESTEEMDLRLEEFCKELAQSNPEARAEMKKMLWQGSKDWTKIMNERAETSGRLVLSEFTKKALKK